MFSIVIPLYNKAPYIEKAIQSVATQTFQEFELIIIDDGSTDESFEKLRVTCYKLQELNPIFFSKITVIKQENQGVSTTRNNGVKLAKYEFIAFLDADDWWEPTFLEEMKTLITEFPEAGIYGSSYFKVKNGKYIPAKIGVDHAFIKGYINYFQIYANTMWMPLTSISIIIPKKVFNRMNGFKPELKLGEDFYLWVQIASSYKVAFLNKQLANYNQDVDVINRAVKEKTYSPSEHMLFANYDNQMNNDHFRFLFEKLALYSLKSDYIANANINEVTKILDSIQWKKHPFKDRLFYKVLPKKISSHWIKLRIFASELRKNFRKLYR